MSSPLDKAGAALLPFEGLAALAGERCRDDVQVIVDNARAWVSWPAGIAAVWRPLLAVRGIIFFEHHDGHWRPLGQRLPRFDVPPPGEPRRLDAILFPAPVTTLSASREMGCPACMRLLPCDAPRPATALRVALGALLPWIESAPTKELSACRAALCGARIIVRGERLPPVPGDERFWGHRVLVPLGFRPEPALPETALRAAAGVSLNELLLLTSAGTEAIPESAFEPLSRAGVRLALCHGAHR